jgi:hypothetical protein
MHRTILIRSVRVHDRRLLIGTRGIWQWLSLGRIRRDLVRGGRLLHQLGVLSTCGWAQQTLDRFADRGTRSLPAQ